MINLLLSTILLVLVIYFCFKQQESFINRNECNFLAWGTNLKNCIDYCQNSPLKSYYDLEGECTDSKCADICNQCTNSERCQWVNPFSKKREEENKDFLVNKNSIKLNGVIENNSLVLNWNKNNTVFDEHYVIYFKEITDDINSLSVLETNVNNYSFSFDDANTTLPLLKKDTEYMFMVYSINRNGSDGISNLLNIKT